MTTSPTTGRRPFGRVALAGFLLALAGLTAGPWGAAADKEPALPPPLAADLKLVPPDALFFATMRVGDLKKAPLADKALDLLRLNDERAVREALKLLLLPPEAIERATVVLPAAGKDFAPEPVLIVRTAKAYDREKLLRAFSPDAKETKFRRRTYHVRSGKGGPREGALHLLDERTFLHGSVGTLGALLGRREGKADENKGPLAAARRLAGKHHVVAAVQPNAMLALWMLEAGGPPRDVDKKVESKPIEKFEKKDFDKLKQLEEERRLKEELERKRREEKKGAFGAVPLARVAFADGLSPVLFVDEAPSAEALPLDNLRPQEALALLPFMPLIRARSAVLTLDVGPEVKIGVRVHCRSAADAEDAETSLRSTLYVGRELLAGGLRETRIDLKGKSALADVFRRVEGSIRSAAVERDKAMVRATLTCKIAAPTLAKAVAEVEHAMIYGRSANNLKQIGIALLNLHDSYGALPAAAICDVTGKPLLSWRVAILPYIEQDNLYRQFNFAEPWDGPTNKKLLARMPRIYAPPPGVKTKQPHSTFYQALVGKEAGFLPGGPAAFVSPQPRPSMGRRMLEITDGTSNTLSVVEAGEAVPWTKPDDLPYDPKGPLPKLGGAFPEGFHAALFDGSVRFIKKGIDEKTLRALITPAGGEVIDWKKVPQVRPVNAGPAPVGPPPVKRPLPGPEELPPPKKS